MNDEPHHHHFRHHTHHHHQRLQGSRFGVGCLRGNHNNADGGDNPNQHQPHRRHHHHHHHLGHDHEEHDGKVQMIKECSVKQQLLPGSVFFSILSVYNYKWELLFRKEKYQQLKF